MESSTLDPESVCELCVAQVVTFYDPTDEKLHYADAAMHSLFHEPCAHCSDEDFVCRIQLCDPCQHLRLRHLLICSPSLLPSTGFPLRMTREASNHCDLCKFSDAVGASRGDGPDSREGAKPERHKLFSIERGSCLLLTIVDHDGGSHGRLNEIRVEISERNRQWILKYID
jgi:hypothetical protein